MDIFTARPRSSSGSRASRSTRCAKNCTRSPIRTSTSTSTRSAARARREARRPVDRRAAREPGSFRRAMKRLLASAIRSGAQGIKIVCGGRLAGTEMSRSEAYSEGRPAAYDPRRHRLRLRRGEDDHAPIGVKVWINKGEICRRDTRAWPRTRGSATRSVPAAAARWRVSAPRENPVEVAPIARVSVRSSAASPVAAAARRADAPVSRTTSRRPRTNEAATSAEAVSSRWSSPRLKSRRGRRRRPRYDHDEGPDRGSDEARGHRRRGSAAPQEDQVPGSKGAAAASRRARRP